MARPDRVICGKTLAAYITYHDDCAVVGIYRLADDRCSIIMREALACYETLGNGATRSARRELKHQEALLGSQKEQTMQKKDYETIAKAIRIATDLYDTEEFANGLRATAKLIADALGATNPRFDKTRFLKACGYGA